MLTRILALALVAGLAPLAACTGGATSLTAEEQAKGIVPVTVTTKGGKHVFKAEPAVTAAEQQRGLMFRTDLTDTSAMLFWPYPAGGGAPKEASFWMQNTPTALDLIFIRPDGTIARIARGEPFDETPIPSGEPVGAVLEVKAGVAAATGMAEGDKVTWPQK
ncbi:DUF192 domain-containing protein [Sphingomonas yantingensis]|jgi:uncharacterized membrane protein (UPF0127 family)|uniref:DUF192 domain-containing protein n=2 Tax=Sphingomonas TaxID=13687 RepID=A0A7W9ASS7_9SPHN|nr:DUF192 domain-containing protein [Sphingomonas yantingensis]MBB5699933.1 hypothetical protein [Sphingomonas yantingensis]HCB74580.1 DUF192 domain-containing protein [Sphingomonas bacterium]